MFPWKPQRFTRRLLFPQHTLLLFSGLIIIVLSVCYSGTSASSSEYCTFAGRQSTQMDSGKLGPKTNSECLKKDNNVSLCKCGFALLDSSFFSEAKMLEIEKGAKEFNVPIIRANRKLVASVNGGLHNPSPLVFNAAWSDQNVQPMTERFSYPSPSSIQRP
nr:Glutamyl-tRNA(Gln) amidotransferase subunit A [Ipomoea batatas]